MSTQSTAETLAARQARYAAHHARATAMLALLTTQLQMHQRMAERQAYSPACLVDLHLLEYRLDRLITESGGLLLKWE
jgi:hypothetical protein